MKKRTAFYILLFVSISFLLCWHASQAEKREKEQAVDNMTKIITTYMEKAYYEGQRDAIDGDIRIKFDYTDQRWHWTKSPWNGGKDWIFDPSMQKSELNDE